MGRAPCCDKTNVKRGPWSPEEDATLRSYLESHGTGGNWIALPHKAGLRRCGKSCRLRWLNYLRPDIKHGCFTQQEDNIIITLYNTIGSRWSVIASHLPGRTDNDVKNYWNTKLKKKLLPHVEQQSTTTTTTQAAATAPRSTPKPINPDPVVLLMPPARPPVPKVVKADQSLYSTPNLSSAATGTGMEFIMSSSYDHELIFDSESELLILPPPPPPPPSLSFPILMQSSTTSSMIFLQQQPPPPQSNNTSTTDDDDDDDDDDHHLANSTITSSCGQLHEVVPLPPDQDGYSSSTTTTSSTSADHHHNWSSTAAINYPCSTTGASTAGGQYGHGGFGDLRWLMHH